MSVIGAAGAGRACLQGLFHFAGLCPAVSRLFWDSFHTEGQADWRCQERERERSAGSAAVRAPKRERRRCAGMERKRERAPDACALGDEDVTNT